MNQRNLQNPDGKSSFFSTYPSTIRQVYIDIKRFYCLKVRYQETLSRFHCVFLQESNCSKKLNTYIVLTPVVITPSLP